MKWIESPNGLQLTIPIELWDNMDGEYIINIARRPAYCDRGDWLIYVDGHNDLDYSDGFPRYFFGTVEEVKQQMETWLNKREAYRKWMNRNTSSA